MIAAPFLNPSIRSTGLEAENKANALISGTIVGREDRAKEIDKHKDDQLQKQKEGKHHWSAELASESEAEVCFRFCYCGGRKAGC